MKEIILKDIGMMKLRRKDNGRTIYYLWDSSMDYSFSVGRIVRKEKEIRL